MPFRSGKHSGQLEEVLWVPKIKENLFSIGKTMDHGCSVEFCNKSSTVHFYRDNKLVLTGHKNSGQHYFLLHLKPLKAQTATEECAFIGASYEDWHKRLGHCSMETVKALIKSGAVEGMQVTDHKSHECTACTLGKLCRAHHPQRDRTQANETTAVLHIDTVGPMKEESIGGSRYFILATEEYSGYKIFQTMSSKAQISDAVKRIVNIAELESGRPVKALMTDNGTEFTNHDLESWLDKRGTVHFYSAAYTPEQNGRAERANRIVLDGIRTLLTDSELPSKFWAEALNTFVYTHNRVIGKRHPDKTHYELFRGSKPNISNLRIFGQKAFVRNTDNARDGKLAPRGEEATFIGYTSHHNTYRFYLDKPVEQIIHSCDVKFISSSNKKQNDEPETAIITEHEPFENPRETQQSEKSQESESIESDTHNSDSSYDFQSASDSTEKPEIERRITRSLAKAHPKSPAVVGVHLGAMFTLDNEPRTVKDAQESQEWLQWKEAMDEEISALEKNKTWTLVDCPPNVRPIKNKWVFKVKLNPDSTVERFKARLVAKGYTQIENIDYKETYAPVASMNAIRMLLAIANQESMHIVQFDIKTAFLYGDLEETLFMEQPEHYVSDPNKVCKLNKSLYGLKQAPRQWNKKFDSFLKLFELKQSNIDKCIYYNSDNSLLLAIYVDDGLAAGRDRKQLDKLIDHLRNNFELKSMDCESYLGLEIKRNLKAKTLDICQARYIDKMLNRFKMTESNPVSTPEQVGAAFDESPQLPTENQFKELLGSLLQVSWPHPLHQPLCSVSSRHSLVVIPARPIFFNAHACGTLRIVLSS